MIPVPVNITIYQGDNFSMGFRLLEDDKVTGKDLTGWTGKCQIRNKIADDPDSVVLQELNFVLADQTDPATRGWVFFTLTPAQTTAMTSGGVYDAQVQNADASERLTPQAGTAGLVKEVTR